MTTANQPILRATHEAIQRERARRRQAREDIVDWGERRFYIKSTRQPIRLELCQKAVLRAMFAQDGAGIWRWTTGLYSSLKKHGKTTIGALVTRWVAETQTLLGECYTVANDLRQAKGREFEIVRDSIRLTPGCMRRAGDYYLPGQWVCQKTKMECLTSGSKIEAISVDAAGEAGAAPDLTCWTEAWGFQSDEARLFYDEMTPVLTKRNSFRFVESYAGIEGVSVLLEDLYGVGMAGRQLTVGELARMAARDRDGDRYEDMLFAFEETEGDPDALVPIWVDEVARLFMYWDSGAVARRMPDQKGLRADAYYAAQAASGMLPSEYARLHENRWAAAQGEFIPIEVWDMCREDLPPFVPEDKETCVIAVDAGVTSDSFAVVAVTRHPMRPLDPAIRAVRKWDPPPGGAIDFAGPEAFLRWCYIGGCVMGHPRTVDGVIDERFSPKENGAFVCSACRDGEMREPYRVQEIAFDAYQLTDMMQRLRRELGVYCKQFDQGKERLIADAQFYQVVMNRRLAHDGNADLRAHVQNAAAELDKSGEHRMRIVKKTPARKVDLLVAASMGVHEILRLILTDAG